MEHIIEAWPLQRLKGGLVTLYAAEQKATPWLEDFAFVNAISGLAWSFHTSSAMANFEQYHFDSADL